MAVDALLRRKWIGLAALAATLSAAVPVPLSLPDLYRAEATLLVERQEVPASLVRPAVTELETRLATIHEEILSRTRLAELIEQFDLYPTLRDRFPLDVAIAQMRRDIDVELTGAEQMGRPATIGVKIGYLAVDPLTAAQVANAIASRYVEENTNLRERQAGRTAEFLEGEVAAMTRELDRQQARLNAFRTRYADELPQQVAANLSALERLNDQLRLNAEHVSRVGEQRDRLIEQLSELETRDIEQTADPELSRLRQRLSELEARFTDRYPEVIQVKTRIAELERRSAGERAPRDVRSERRGVTPAPRERLEEGIRGTEADLAQLAEEEQRLRAVIASYDERIKAVPTREQELEELTLDYAIARELYQSLLGRYEEAKLGDSLEQAKKGETFRILDPALPPNQPAAPKRIRLLALVLLLGLVAAAGAVLLTERLDTSFETVDELRQVSGLPVLGTIPYISGPGDTARQIFRTAAVTLAVAACSLLAVASRFVAHDNTELVRMLARGEL